MYLQQTRMESETLNTLGIQILEWGKEWKTFAFI